MNANIKYEFHHFGIPVQDGNHEGSFSEKAGWMKFVVPGASR